MDPPKQVVPVISDGNTTDDTERQGQSENEKIVDTSPPLNQSISSWKWYSICVGLYLTAVLYGMPLTQNKKEIAIILSKLTKYSQA